MTEGKFSYFDFAPKVVEKKGRYRDDDTRDKLTYNFVTDPRIKRGHNFGVVYVTTSALDEQEGERNKKESLQLGKESNDEKARKILEENDTYIPPGRQNFGVNTEKVVDLIRPKPQTCDYEVQTEDYIDHPQIPLFWPQKIGEDKETQIEEGDLFNFDEDVEPIVAMITSKILEQSRMEVLEEEEIKEMKRHQQEFEKIRNRELEDVQKLENEERRKFEEKNRRKAERELRISMSKIFQKKLICRMFGKGYLNRLKILTLTHLENVGVLKNPNLNEYYLNLLPFIRRKTETISRNDDIVVNHMSQNFQGAYIELYKNKHKLSMEREHQRKEELKQQREMEIKKQQEEKIKRREEKKRIQHEKEIAILKNTIYAEFITNQAQYVDDATEIFDITGFHQKNAKIATAIGGHIGQFAIVFAYLNKIVPDSLNEERLSKIMDLFLVKSAPFYLLYKQEDLDQFKAMDANIVVAEDVFKSQDTIYYEIIKLICTNFEKHDEMLPNLFKELCAMEGFENIRDMFNLVISVILKLVKTSTDPPFTDKIKFLLKDAAVDENFAAICILNPTSIHRPKPILEVVSQPVTNVKTKPPAGKKPQPVQQVKQTFDPFFPEKSVIVPVCTEKMKMIGINFHFERMLRQNILDCVGKVVRYDQDKETLIKDFEEFYMKFADDFINKLAKDTYKTEKIEIEIEAPVN